MTAPLPHRKHTMENAARLARELDMTVRLEADGAVTFIPAIHKPDKSSGVDGNPYATQRPKEWNQRGG